MCSLVLFPFMFPQTFSNLPKYLPYMLTLNLIRKLYIPFVLKALQEPKPMQETTQKKEKFTLQINTFKEIFIYDSN